MSEHIKTGEEIHLSLIPAGSGYSPKRLCEKWVSASWLKECIELSLKRNDSHCPFCEGYEEDLRLLLSLLVMF